MWSGLPKHLYSKFYLEAQFTIPAASDIVGTILEVRTKAAERTTSDLMCLTVKKVGNTLNPGRNATEGGKRPVKKVTIEIQ